MGNSSADSKDLDDVESQQNSPTFLSRPLSSSSSSSSLHHTDSTELPR